MEIDRRAPNYAELCRTFRWQVPERYNIARDICGRWADERSRFALYYEEESGFTSAHTFWDIQREANRLSNVLAALGTLAGDRVAVALPQRPEAAIAHVAIYQMGAIAVPLSPHCRPAALEHRLGDSAAHLVILDQVAQPTLAQIHQRLPQLRHVIGVAVADGAGIKPWAEVLEHASPRYTALETGASDPAIIVYPRTATGGGAKGVVMAQRTLLGKLSAYVCAHNFLPQARDLFWSPAGWGSAGGLWNVLLPTWHFGLPLLAYNGRFEAARVFDLMERYGVRNSFLSPAELTMMMQAVADPRAIYDLDLRTLASAGEPLGETVLHWASEKLGVTINQLSAHDAMSGVFGGGAPRWPAKPGAMGRAFPGHRVAVVDGQGKELPPGEVGELAVHRQCRSEDDPVVMLGYWQDAAVTAGAFVGDGWVLTGELARMDEEGYFWQAAPKRCGAVIA